MIITKKKLIDGSILLTSSTGFIGYYFCKRLLAENQNTTIIGIDNMNDYYRSAYTAAFDLAAITSDADLYDIFQ